MSIKKHIAILSFCLLCGMHTMAQQTERVYLSGKGSDDAVKWEFYCSAGMNAGKWTTIPVPSCWELQGFGKYDYGFAKDSVRGKERGSYKYSFNASSSWKGKHINIVFEGVMTDAIVKINGKIAGPVHQGAFYAFKYDISKLLKYGSSNQLEVTVAKHSANESVNAAERRADFWIFGGIFRPVWLEVLPETHISRLLVNAKVDGTFQTDIAITGKADKATIQLLTADGKKFGSSITQNFNGNNHLLIEEKFPAPLLWSPEFPNLYTAIIEIHRGEKLLHRESQKVGFRSVEVRQRDGIYVNNVKVKMKGVNRHSFRPETGRTMNMQNSIEDILLMKDMNMNAVRMAHYPPDDHYLNACDSLGLFVMDELAGWHGHYDDTTGKKLVREMMLHDRNHPSIILWANGNEGGHNPAFDTLFAEYELEPRPVVHPWQLFGGIETQHYREYNYGIGNYDQGNEIVMPTEFLHGQFDGGHGAGLEDYWEKMWHSPRSAGGFLWDFADQGVVRKDLNDSIDTDKHRGADGIVGPHHEKEASYYTIKEVWSPIKVEHRVITPTFNGEFTIWNRFHYTNTNQCSFSWRLAKLGDVNGRYKTAGGSMPSPTILPGQSGILKVDLPAGFHEYDVLYLTATGVDKKEIFTWSFPLTTPSREVAKIDLKNAGTKPNITGRDSLYTITAGEVTIVVNKNNGLLTEVRKAGTRIPFDNGPILQEGVNNFKEITYAYAGDILELKSKFDRKSSYNTLTWTIYPSGIIRLDISYFPSAYFTDRVGINFSFPETDLQSVQYMGDGPYRVWKNRMKGNRFGVWDKSYNNTETGESPWKYPEFKGYHSNMYWCRFNMKNGESFRVMTSNENLFLRLFTPAWKTDQWHNYEPIFPSGDISFMQGIPSIGTKTQRNETTGPMGSKNIFYDYEKDPERALKLTLYFDFR